MSIQRPGISEKRHAFARLHRHGCFVIPNPWDVGSACYLQSAGFKALATTSSGFAWSQGLRDGAVPREAMLAHLRQIVEATDIPVNADYLSGFGRGPREVGESVRMAVDTGVAGLSIEDSTGDAERPLYDIDSAVARLRAARDAIDRAGGEVLLVGRAECFLVGRPDLDETVARLKAYSQAGADCLYAPGIRTPEQIAAVVAAVAPKPVNLLVGSATGLTLPQIEALGVRRVSVGGALARAAWGGLIRCVELIAQQGRFDAFAAPVPTHAQIDSLFRAGSTPEAS